MSSTVVSKLLIKDLIRIIPQLKIVSNKSTHPSRAHLFEQIIYPFNNMKQQTPFEKNYVRSLVFSKELLTLIKK